MRVVWLLLFDFLTFISVLCTTFVIARERSTSENLDRGCSGLLSLLTAFPQQWEAAGSLGIARVKGAPRSARCTPCTARDTKLQSSNLWLNQSLSLSKAHSSVLQFIPDCPFFFPSVFLQCMALYARLTSGKSKINIWKELFEGDVVLFLNLNSSPVPANRNVYREFRCLFCRLKTLKLFFF